jgi:HD-GYP domain-containing protein (c-di-GMP phosphodiesterase class II)
MLQIRNALNGTVGLATLLRELRDLYTVGHERRVAHLARAIGAGLGLGSDRMEGLWVAGSRHDVGKMMVPMEILSKPGRITVVAVTMEAMSSHRPYRPALGLDAALAEITRGRGTAYDEAAVDACLHLFRNKNYVLQA